MRTHLLAALLTVAGSTAAQDLIAVGWNGGLYAIDSYSGAGTQIGSGITGQNAMARDGNGGLWSNGQNGVLSRIDPAVPSATPVYPGTGLDLRGLASAGGPFLYGITNSSPTDSLVRIDTSTGTWVTIGSLGFDAVQALTNHLGTLYAYDVNAGLLVVDPLTGAALDLAPSLPAPADIQWLTTRSDGALIGGRNAAFVLDPGTGAVLATISGAWPDLRGADGYQSHAHAFGTGCNGALGPVLLSAYLTPLANGTRLTCDSINHAANSPGLAFFGVSNTSAGGVPLPVLLDPLFGTVGCTLYTSIDVSLLAVASGSALQIQVDFPPTLDVFPFYTQHFALENVPGGVSLSNAVAIQLGY
ncbi:MAG: hypothetical protein JNN13_00140 [Planctomycetes bacterium]|nr:hypothetical protein [Planctomycetota bacterium]